MKSDLEKEAIDDWNSLEFQEWAISRALVDKFEDRVYDLRKYGFSFITALLTAQAILVPSSIFTGPDNAPLPDGIKAAVFGVTLLLILTVLLFEKSYRLLQRAAEQRTKVLEARLNLELIEKISYQYNFRNVWCYKLFIYVFLIAATIILAYFIIPNHYYALILAILSYLGLLSIEISIHLKPHLNKSEPGDDWTIDKVECQQGEKVGITLTNFNEKERILHSDDVICKIKDKDGYHVLSKLAGAKIEIPVAHNYTWLLDTTNLKEGIYQIIVEDKYPLKRKIRIINE